MKQALEISDDEGAILMCFAGFLENDGIEALARYLKHCKIKMADGMTAEDAILAHYRNPIGYDIDRAAMDLRTWPPVAARIFELQTDEAESRAKRKAKQVRQRRAMNGHAAGEHSI